MPSTVNHAGHLVPCLALFIKRTQGFLYVLKSRCHVKRFNQFENIRFLSKELDAWIKNLQHPSLQQNVP